jgi:hypothetical protein
MKPTPFIILAALLLASCATLHKETASSSASASDTTHITVVDTTHVTIFSASDSSAAANSHRRDSIIIKEQIITHYDPSTGMMIEQIFDKLTSQVTDLSEYRETILHQQHLIDSLLTANLSLHSAHQSDSTSTSSITEKGDAARTGWQSTLNSGKYIFLFGIILLVLVEIIKHYRKK